MTKDMKMVLVFKSFLKLSLWVSLGLWIKSVVINSLDHRLPSHQDSSASCLSISNLNTLTLASHKPCTSAYHEERETLRERENREWGMDVRLTMHSSFLSSSPSATQQREREREKSDGSNSSWPPCSCCFNMPRGHHRVYRTPVALPII